PRDAGVAGAGGGRASQMEGPFFAGSPGPMAGRHGRLLALHGCALDLSFGVAFRLGLTCFFLGSNSMEQLNREAVAITEWGGWVFPYSIGHKKLGMWLFLLSDSLTFSSLLIGYSYLRVGTPAWPKPFHMWPSIATATLMTLVLLSSSLTMVKAVAASQRGDH